MQGQDNIISFAGGPTRESTVMLDAKGQRIVSECRTLVSKLLPQLMVGLFEQIDDALYELADKSDNNCLQSSYFDAMRVLRKEQLHIDRKFNRQILRSYDHYWKSGQIEKVKRSLDELNHDSEMALLDNEELEDSLAITNMISKSENRYSRECYALTQRFSYLISGGRYESGLNDQNPLEPAVICHAFQVAMHEISIELPVKLVVYKLFEKHVIHYLGGLYDEINLLFGRFGVIPKLTPRVRRNPVAPTVRNAAAASGQSPMDSCFMSRETGPVSMGSGGIDVAQGEVFATLQQLLNLRRASGHDRTLASSRMMAGVPGVSVPAVDTEELLGVLSMLQRSNVLLPQAGERMFTPKVIRARLLDDLHMRDGGEVTRSLADADNDTIDVVSMLFEFILEDFSLPDAMRALLSRLQIPMLKVAVIDKAFFSKKGHPARCLLNSLARAAIGWNDSLDRENDGLYHKTESIIKRIQNDFYHDPSIFAELEMEFSTWWEQEQRGAEVAEQRTNQVTRGKEQLRGAKQIVVQELNRRLQNQDLVPEAVLEILDDGWKDVLLLNYLRQGPESDEWRDSLAIVDRLLWSIQPKTVYAERQELLRGIPELLRNLRERLNSISFDQHKMARLFKELQNCHIACLRGGEANATKGPGTAPSKLRQISFPDNQLVSGSSSFLADEPADSKMVQRDEYTRQAEELEIGSWLEVTDGDSKSRLKLSWKSNVTDAYIFVNRKGMKAMELTQQGLAKRMRDGSAKRVDLPKTPLMDRALDSLLTTLKNTDHASTPA